MKYETLKALKAAYDSGELAKSNPLMLDNDCTFVYTDDAKVFNGGMPEDLLREALALLGIPNEGV